MSQPAEPLCTCYYLPHAVNCTQRLVDATTPPNPRFVYVVDEEGERPRSRWRVVRVDRRTGRRWRQAAYDDAHVAHAIAIMLTRYATEEAGP